MAGKILFVDKETTELKLKEIMGSMHENREVITEVINEILQEQHSLNIALTKNENYAKELKTSTGKPINFGDCLISEAIEIQDSTPWKHWKAGGFNDDNINTEIIDNFHFAPSVLLTLGIHELSKNYNYFGIIDRQRLRAIELFARNKDLMYAYIKNEFLSEGLNLSRGYAVAQAMEVNFKESMNVFKTRHEFEMSAYTIISYSLFFYMINNEIFDAAVAIKEIFKKYLVKNTLNTFRMENGYEEGTYVKIWVLDSVGYEDNDVAFGIYENAERDNVDIKDIKRFLLDKLTASYNSRD